MVHRRATKRCRLRDPNKQCGDFDDENDNSHNSGFLTLAVTPQKRPQARLNYNQLIRELDALTSERRDEINAQFAAVLHDKEGDRLYDEDGAEEVLK